MNFLDCTTEKAYLENFRDPKFGESECYRILDSLKIDPNEVNRKIEGSSLLFKVDKTWLKLTPPFWIEAFEVERKLLRHFDKKLSVQIPHIIHEGDFGGWKYILLSHVEGSSFAEVQQEFGDFDRDMLVDDLSRILQEVVRVTPVVLERSFGNWRDYAKIRIRDMKFHKEKGISDFWIDQIANLLTQVGHEILSLDEYRIIHADLNHEHILFQKSTCWRMRGLIDFADGMLAPKEIELILPFLIFFRSDRDRQKKLLNQIGLDTSAYPIPFSRLMMGLTLCNRFIHFEEWFSREIIKEGIGDIGEIADRVFAVR